MRRLHSGAISALALVLGMSAAQADAQSLRGFRAEGQSGWTSFHSEGSSDSHFGWGAAVGVDAYVANNFVLGAEATRARVRRPATRQLQPAFCEA